MAATAFVILALVCCSAFPTAYANARFTDEEKEEILRAHNSFRASVTPLATNMERMEWNDELSYLAQFWSTECQLMIDEERSIQSSEFDYVGQNMADTASYSVNYTILMQNKWFAQGRGYDFYTGYCTDEDGNANEDGEGCEYYRQLVWANSYAVGCGVYKCDEIEGSEDVEGNGLLFVCFYGPGGNFAGEAPYITGSNACTSCPNGKSKCIDSLCSEESGAPPAVAHSTALLSILLILGAMSSLL